MLQTRTTLQERRFRETSKGWQSTIGDLEMLIILFPSHLLTNAPTPNATGTIYCMLVFEMHVNRQTARCKCVNCNGHLCHVKLLSSKVQFERNSFYLRRLETEVLTSEIKIATELSRRGLKFFVVL